MKQTRLSRELDRRLAAPMFCLSLLFLLLAASVLHLREASSAAGRVCAVGMLLCYPVFFVEVLLHFWCGSRQLKQHAWFCVLPILRIGARDHGQGNTIWLPRNGWRRVDRELVQRLTRAFSIPMIVIALCVLPVIVLEFFWTDFINNHRGWRMGIQIAQALIWAAFTFEFILLIAVVNRKWQYARRHWIDLAIILLPLLAFARTLRLTQLLKVKQLSRTARVYRLRGLAIRMWRGFVALEVVDMLINRNPERRLEHLHVRLEEKLHEVEELKQEIVATEKRAAERAKKTQENEVQAQKQSKAPT